MDSRTELLLYQAARAQLVEEIIAPVLNRGGVVLADRFYWSTLAYQGYGRGLVLGEIEMLNNFAVGVYHPDLTFYFDLPPEKIEERLKSSGKIADRLESEGKDFFLKVRQGYIALAERKPNQIVVISAEMAVEAIAAKIREVLTEKKIL